MKISDVNQGNKMDVQLSVKESSKSNIKGNKKSENNENNIGNNNDVKKVMTEEMIDKSVKQANKALEKHNRRIDRSVHEKTKTIMYKMVDTETDEIIREFPPKKIQDMIAKMWELAGLFVDEEV